MNGTLRKSAMRLHGRAEIIAPDSRVRIIRLVEPSLGPESHADHNAVLIRNGEVVAGRSAIVRIGAGHPTGKSGTLGVSLQAEFAYLEPGDILRVNPAAQQVNVLYRRNSASNSLLFTERCNSLCLMCSQPPRDVDDRYLVDEILEAIPLMDPDTAEIGITGGEPTLRFAEFLAVMEALRTHLPTTAVHVLTNGRLFAYPMAAARLKAVSPTDLMLGVPVYSADPERHEFVVQAKGAFDQTIRGLLSLARVGVPVEIRCVIHRQTYEGLPQLAEFIARNLPFAAHVALMGLEPMGHVKMNLEALWIDPVDYQHELDAAVRTLDRAGLRVSVYNHQLCTLDRGLWPFAVQSISDWKNIYHEECEGCTVQAKCPGFFASSNTIRSRAIRAIAQPCSDEVSAEHEVTSSDWQRDGGNSS